MMAKQREAAEEAAVNILLTELLSLVKSEWQRWPVIAPVCDVHWYCGAVQLPRCFKESEQSSLLATKGAISHYT